MRKKFPKNEKVILIGVVKNRRDLKLIRKEHWYRMPARYAPVRTYTHIAFYQPAVFGNKGKQIRYFARVKGNAIRTRRDLLPNEHSHARANELYIQVRLGNIQQLKPPVRNTVPRRVVFGFTTLRALKHARNMLDVYEIVPTEVIVGRLLKHMHIHAVPQYPLHNEGKRFRIDFAILRRQGNIAIECDNHKAHRGHAQHEKDILKNKMLRKHGWYVLRISDSDIISNLPMCVKKIHSV